MFTYLVTAQFKLYTINRLVQASSKAAAVATVDTTNARSVWVEDVTGQEEGL